MKTTEAVKHFGSKSEVARALGITSAAVAQWGEVVPRLRQYELQQITRGKLRVDMNGRRAAIA